MTSEPPNPGDEEASLDNYGYQLSPPFHLSSGHGGEGRVTVDVSDCDNEDCRKCYEPVLLSIGPVADPNECLQLDISEGWQEVDNLITALTNARQLHSKPR